MLVAERDTDGVGLTVLLTATRDFHDSIRDAHTCSRPRLCRRYMSVTWGVTNPFVSGHDNSRTGCSRIHKQHFLAASFLLSLVNPAITMPYGIIIVTLSSDDGGTRTVTFVTSTPTSHFEFAPVLRHSSVDGTDVLEELLLGATAPPDALAEDGPLAQELKRVYESRPGGARNPHNLMDD